jgi:hypothetical protein
MGTPQELIEQYRDAFSRGDLDALVEFFGFPSQVVSVTDAAAVSVVQRLTGPACSNACSTRTESWAW